ncbi:MAG: hypothetical protein LBD73_00795 [Deferribacteraceae bacterium]|nr:hypothetical protein [Deferribacteraceae bacterium]
MYKYEMSVQKQLHLSFPTYLDKYFLPHYMLNTSAKSYLYLIKRFRKVFEDMYLDKIKSSLIEQTIIELSAGRKASYFNAHIEMVRRIFQYAVFFFRILKLLYCPVQSGFLLF